MPVFHGPFSEPPQSERFIVNSSPSRAHSRTQYATIPYHSGLANASLTSGFQTRVS